MPHPFYSAALGAATNSTVPYSNCLLYNAAGFRPRDGIAGFASPGLVPQAGGAIPMAFRSCADAQDLGRRAGARGDRSQIKVRCGRDDPGDTG